MPILAGTIYIDEWGQTAPTAQPAPAGPAPTKSTETIGGVPVGQAIQVATNYITPPSAAPTGAVTTVTVASAAPPSFGGGGSLGTATGARSLSGHDSSAVANTHSGRADPYVWKGQARPNANTPKPKDHASPRALTAKQIAAQAEAEVKALSKKLIAKVEAGKITASEANKGFAKGVQEIRKTEFVQLQPRLEPAHGAGQGKPAWQRVPYYRGQPPTSWSPLEGAVYKNPEWVPSLNQLALGALTPAQLAYMHREHQQNAERFGADVRWLAEHPAVVAAALATASLIPEADPFILNLSDVFSGIAAGKAAKEGHYYEALLDLASFSLAKLANRAAVAARHEASVAVKAKATAEAAQHAIDMHPSITKTPNFLVQEFVTANKALRQAELGATRLRTWAAYERRIGRAFAYGAAVIGSEG
jgi:hypothetical protein